MAASKTWTESAADRLVRSLGTVEALDLVRELKELPRANKSVRQTMANLEAALVRRLPKRK